MPTIADVQALLTAESGLAVVCTTRRDAGIQASVVNVGVLRHSQRDVVAFVARGGAVKLSHLRRDPRATVVARSGWQWIAVEGSAEVIGPDDPGAGVEPDDVAALLRSVFQCAGGTHDDWAEYDRTMREERRAAVLITPERIYSNPG